LTPRETRKPFATPTLPTSVELPTGGRILGPWRSRSEPASSTPAASGSPCCSARARGVQRPSEGDGIVPPGWGCDDGFRLRPDAATADLLIGLLDRVPLSEAQIARATLADPATIQAWLRRREAPAGLEAQRLTELVAFVEEMAHNIRGDALPEWIDRDVPFLDSGNPLDELAGGGYERLIQLALGLTHSVFT
jgi:hypothetical protein